MDLSWAWAPHLNTVVLSLPGLCIPSTLVGRKVKRGIDRNSSGSFRTHLAYLPLHLLHCFFVPVNLLLRLSLVPSELLLHQIQLVRQSSAFHLCKCKNEVARQISSVIHLLLFKISSDLFDHAIGLRVLLLQLVDVLLAFHGRLVELKLEFFHPLLPLLFLRLLLGCN